MIFLVLFYSGSKQTEIRPVFPHGEFLILGIVPIIFPKHDDSIFNTKISTNRDCEPFPVDEESIKPFHENGIRPRGV